MAALSPLTRRNRVEVFQVDYTSVLDGILNGSNMPDASEKRPSRVDRTSLALGTGFSQGLVSPKSASRSPFASPLKTKKNRVSLSQEDKRRLLVGSDLVSPRKKASKPSSARGLQQYFSSKKSPPL